MTIGSLGWFTSTRFTRDLVWSMLVSDNLAIGAVPENENMSTARVPEDMMRPKLLTVRLSWRQTVMVRVGTRLICASDATQAVCPGSLKSPPVLL